MPSCQGPRGAHLTLYHEFISPAKDQHGFRPRHSTTSALLQLTTDIEAGFNQRKPPHRTVCVAMDLTAAFDTVSHDKLISKIAGSSLPPAITRWLACYLRGRQAATSFRGTKSSTRIVAPASLKDHSCHLPCSTITWLICQGRLPWSRGFATLTITAWATGPKFPQLESMINSYLREVSFYLKDNSLLISAPKSIVTLFTPDKHQSQMHHDITLEDTQLPLETTQTFCTVYCELSGGGPRLSWHHNSRAKTHE